MIDHYEFFADQRVRRLIFYSFSSYRHLFFRSSRRRSSFFLALSDISIEHRHHSRDGDRATAAALIVIQSYR